MLKLYRLPVPGAGNQIRREDPTRHQEEIRPLPQFYSDGHVEDNVYVSLGIAPWGGLSYSR